MTEVTELKKAPLVGKIFACFLILVIGTGAIYNSHRWYLDEVHKKNQHQLDIYEVFIETEIKRFHELTKLISEDLKMREILSANNPKKTPLATALVPLFMNFKRSLEVLDVMLFDLNGDIVASTNDEPSFKQLSKHNFAFRAYFQKARQGQVGEELGIGIETKKAGLYVSYPVWVGTTQEYVIAVKFSLSNLEPKELERQQNKFLLIDDKGLIFVASEPTFKFKSFASLSLSEISNIKKNGQDASLMNALGYEDSPLILRGVTLFHLWREGSRKKQSDVEQTFFVTKRKISSSGWNLILLQDLEDVWLTLALQGGMIFLLLAFIGVVLAYFLQRQAYQETLIEQAIRDPLTKLYTRLHMNRMVPLLLEANKRGTIAKLSVVLLDVDYFKKVNDTYGHKAGDMVLARIGQMLLAECRLTDLPVRTGGEELLIIAPSGKDEVFKLAERIRIRLSTNPISIGQESIFVTISGGIAERIQGESFDDLVHRADVALYRAKNSGRNQICNESLSDAGSPVLSGIGT